MSLQQSCHRTQPPSSSAAPADPGSHSHPLPGKPHLLPSESKEKPAGSIDSYLKSANSWLAEKKDIAERLLKNTSAKTENVKGFFGGLETKLKGPLVRKNE